jgi:aldehyde:ferredoxin oxidoreductase
MRQWRGWRGRILRVQLESGSVRAEELPLAWVQHYLGGKGLGTCLQQLENPPGTDPLSPDNRLILVNGPAAGTAVPTATRLALFARSPLNGLTLESYLGGSFGHYMKKAGYDAIILEGRAAHPVSLLIADGEVRLEEAGGLWGREIYDTEGALKQAHGEQAQVLSIGPAGEKLVRYACVGHNRHRHFGRMGAGAVFGAKNLKAVVLKGSQAVEVHDPAGLRDYVRELNQRIREHPGTGKVYPLSGTVNFVAKANAIGVFPSHYWSRGQAAAAERIGFEFMREHTLVRQTRCHACLIGCAHINRVREGPYQGVEIDGPEFETIYVFGGLCDVGDLREIIKLNDCCDRLGLDTMHAGNVLGLLMEATSRGRLAPPYRLAWGDTPAMLRALEGIAAREGFWRLAGEGLRPLAAELGLEAVQVKGLEPAGYDPRGVQSMAVTYGVGNRGATHLSSNSYARDISGQAREHELAGPDRSVDRFSLSRKAELVANMIDFNAIADCLVLCRFLNRDLLAWGDYSRMLYLLTGLQKSETELKAAARDIATLGRWYNLGCGLGPQDDLLPERFFGEAHADGGSAGRRLSREEYLAELGRYYALRGWNGQGVPGYRPWLPQVPADSAVKPGFSSG